MGIWGHPSNGKGHKVQNDRGKYVFCFSAIQAGPMGQVESWGTTVSAGTTRFIQLMGQTEENAEKGSGWSKSQNSHREECRGVR